MNNCLKEVIINEVQNAYMKLRVRKLQKRLRTLAIKAFTLGIDRLWFPEGEIEALHRITISELSWNKYKRILWKKRKLIDY